MIERIARIAGAVAILAFAIAPSGIAHAQTPSFVEHIDLYNVQMHVDATGRLDALERITYDFGTGEHHGIFRDLVKSEVYTGKSGYDRVYRLHVEGVTVDNNESVPVKTSTQGRYLHMRIGDPNRTISGTHTYTIRYTVDGALTGFPDHDELYWNAIGLQWPVPIDNAAANVSMPAPIDGVACYAGPLDSRLACDRATKRGQMATFATSGLSSDEGMSVVVGFPKGYVRPAPQPILQKRWNMNDAFARRTNTLGPAGALAVLGIGGVALLAWRKGRDRRYTGSAVDQAMGNATGAEERVPVLRDRDAPVEFVPPDKIRPGEVGVLLDENANLLDVTATIVDLAVRGYLKITELPPEGLFRRRHDYQLDRLDQPDDALLPYERQILSALFSTGTTVALSELKYKFRADLAKIRNAMYDDAVKQGWYRIRPDKTRAAWHAIAIVVLILGAVATFFVARATTFGLVPVAIVLTGIALLVTAHNMPARTGKGSAMLSRVRGFRHLFDQGDEDIRARFAEQHNIFSEYLPFAIVFGCATKWAKAFEGLDAEALGTTGWYSGHDALNALVIAHSMDDFGTVATGTLYASQPSSSGGSGFGGGGFSGGGGGGGGGGSW